MIIPKRINQLLLNDGELGGSVIRTWSSAASALKTCPQGLFFFPDFTDHGPKHIEGVLASCEELISTDSHALITPQDAGVLVLATLLHDAAMHLDAQSFLTLIGSSSVPLCKSLDTHSWAKEFESFVSEAARWSDNKFRNVFGGPSQDGGNTDCLAVVRQNPFSMPAEKWTEQYRRFLGEFVRRHHARIAHEIALGVFKQSTWPFRLILEDIDPKIRDLSGLVARSHNLPIRATFEYLKREHGGRAICRNTHPVFLMGVLRIADYLQIDSKRISYGLFGVRALRSPLSDAEWKAHFSVSDIRPDEHDAESIFVFAEPPDAATFLKLRKLILGLQQELDLTWAAFGEVYSQSTQLRKLGLTIRRVRSNLESPEDYVLTKSPPYFPVDAAFRTADAALLKLLIKPLYGSSPDIAVRELLQNSLDAVRELNEFRQRHSSEIALSSQPANVVLKLERIGDNDWFTISDQGIGMTATTVRDYFLTAGASFRNSDEWWKQFGIKGHSAVLRSGRFGIGALAAFLLGPKLSVVTRHAQSRPEDGIEFDASVDQENIELRRTIVPHVGTTIRIQLTPQAAAALRDQSPWWDWYLFDQPTIAAFIDGEKRTPSQLLPSWQHISNDSDWTLVDANGFEKIQWSYPCEPEYDKAEDVRGLHSYLLGCNGLRIGKMESSYQEEYYIASPLIHFHHEIFRTPSVLFYDPDGTLPLTLQRDNLSDKNHPFLVPLAVSISLDLIAFFLVHGPSSFNEIGVFLDPHSINTHMYGLWEKHPPENCLFSFEDGFGASTPTQLLHVTTKQLLHINVRSGRSFMAENYAPSIPQIFGQSPTNTYHSVLYRMWMPDPGDEGEQQKGFASRASLLIPRPDSLRYLRRITRDAHEEKIPHSALKGGGVIFFSDNSNHQDSLLPSINQRMLKTKESNIATVAELYIDTSATLKPSIFDKVWQEICGPRTIPFSPEKRRKEMSGAFEMLRPQIAKWENPSPNGWRAQTVKNITKKKQKLASGAD